jgi:hypothetical protein
MERVMRGMLDGEPAVPAEGAAETPIAAAPLRLNRLVSLGLTDPPFVSAAPAAPAPPPAGPFVPPPLGFPSPGFPPGMGNLPFPVFPTFPPQPQPPVPQPPPGRAFPPLEPPVLQPPPRRGFPPPGRGFPFPFPFPEPVPAPVKTATQLARSAISTLDEGSPEVVGDAVNTLRARGIPGPELLDFLERRVRVGEVLNQMAATWSDATGGDFADAFQMDASRRDVMDAIVAIAILSDPQLDDEILVENTPQTQEQDLLDNRMIVDQWPQGGTVMQPPYMILVAVEYRNVAQAGEVVRSIMDQLAEHEGFKLTRGSVQKIRGR